MLNFRNFYCVGAWAGCVMLAWTAWAEPIQITSESLDVRHVAGEATFVGNVVVRQGATTLRAPRIVVHYGPNGKGGVSTMETLGFTTLTRRVADKTETAESDKAVYDPRAQKLTLQGHVKLNQNGNTLMGRMLVYDLSTGRIKLTGPAGVQGQFEVSQ